LEVYLIKDYSSIVVHLAHFKALAGEKGE